MPSFKSAYLIHGDDHGRIAERRARLRALAESESGTEGVEVFAGEQATPEIVAAALAAMTLAPGRRFVIVDGAERFRAQELEPLLAALGGLPADTTVAFFAREDGRVKAPDALADAVREAGGDVAAESALKPWQLPKWTAARAREMDIELGPGAARALVDHVGERQQRILRELERLALELGAGASLDADQVIELTAGSAQRRLWTLADAMLAGDEAGAVRIYLELRAQGERMTGVVYALARRLRDGLDAARRLEAGASEAQVKGALKGPRGARELVVRGARRLGAERLREALATLADLELRSRGGGSDALDEDSAAMRAITAIAA